MGDLISLLLSRDNKEIGRKGLVDGVGRDVLGSSDGGPLAAAKASLGENREGTVPARALRVLGCALVSDDGGTKSGKPSWLGDSGMVSRRGVEPPLAGGPQRFGVVNPSCACISRALSLTSKVSHRSAHRHEPLQTFLYTSDLQARVTGNQPQAEMNLCRCSWCRVDLEVQKVTVQREQEVQ